MTGAPLVLLVVLEVLVVLPLPVTLALFAGAEAGASWPVLWLLAGGFAAVCVGVAARSRPLALLLAWAGARTLAADLPIRSTLLLAEAVAVLGLYLLAASLPIRADRWLLGGLAVAALLTAWVGLEQVIGVSWSVDALTGATGLVMRPLGWSARPQQTWLALAPDVRQRSGLFMLSTTVGQPHGFLTHPNYFGVFLALALPAALQTARAVRWPRAWRGGPQWAVVPALVAMVLLSRSRTAWVALGALGLVWLCGRLGSLPWVRDGLVVLAVWAGTGTGLAVVTGVLAPESFGFRLRAWRLGWEAATRAPWAGWGVGTWRFWALDPAGPIAAWMGERDAGWWADAFNEPLQLFFELGAVGLALGLLCLGQLARDAWFARRANAEAQAWAAVVAIGLVALWTTSLFHYPPLMVPMLIAAARLRRDA